MVQQQRQWVRQRSATTTTPNHGTPPHPHPTPTRPRPPAFAWLQVKVTPIPGKRADHQGIRVQLLGEVELASERGYPHQFLSLGERRAGACVEVPHATCVAERSGSSQLAGGSPMPAPDAARPHHASRCVAVRDLAPPGELSTQATLPFEFGSVEMQYESFRGSQVGAGSLRCEFVGCGTGEVVFKSSCEQLPSSISPSALHHCKLVARIARHALCPAGASALPAARDGDACICHSHLPC